MNLLRRFLPHDPSKVDLQKHDQILQQMQDVTNKLRTGDPITRMVRGVWRSEPGRDVLIVETTTEEGDGHAED